MSKMPYKYKSFWPLLLVATYLLFGFFYAPKLIKKHLKIQLQQQLDTHVELSAVTFNPLTFYTEITDLKLTDRNHITWYSSQQTAINFDPLNLIWGEWKFSNLKLMRPSITLSTDESGQVIIPAIPEFTTATKSEDNINLTIDGIQMIQGSMNLQAGNIKNDFALNLKNIEISHNKFSMADENTYFNIKLTTDNNESMMLNGHYNHVQQLVQSKIKLTDWQATTLNQVLPNDLFIDNQSGQIHAEGQMNWPLQHKPRLNFSTIQIDNLAALWQNTVELLGFTATINDVTINTETQQVNISRFFSDQASWQITWPIELPEKMAVENADSMHQVADVAPSDEETWQVLVQNTNIKHWSIELIDKSISAQLPIKIDSLTITAFNTMNEPIQLIGKFNATQHGSITINSEQSLSPLMVQGDLILEAIYLPDLAPWIAAQSGLVITRGSLTSQQSIVIDNNNMISNGALSVMGSLIQNQSGLEIADIGQLIIGATHISSENKTITLDQMTLDHAHGNILIENDAKLNIQSLTGSDAVEQNSEPPNEWLILVGAINTKNNSKD